MLSIGAEENSESYKKQNKFHNLNIQAIKRPPPPLLVMPQPHTHTPPWTEKEMNEYFY